ncbi:AAA family ATPase [Deinococcus fonticola]|uniref:AAA family ATPase n=1 Tax=Deinococcus fonticola TaxID=2528713 RepID=UPI001F0EBDB4|nr:SMC family ATPase [Deinococcus fonticola]
MTAFGPYKDTQVVNFDELGENGLFLLHGPTGAGKTSILDAICVALFGESSGDERKAKEFRSDLASDQAVTRVEFDFSMGQRTFTISRQPSQTLPNKKTPLLHEVELLETTAVASGQPAKLLGTGVGAVEKQITELLGLTGSQFRQVVILPQGKFRELLTADSKTREEVLRVLFNTSDQAQLEKSLKNMASENKTETTRLHDLIQTLLQRYEAVTLTELGGKLGKLGADIESIEPDLKVAKGVREAAKSQLDAASRVAELFLKLEKAEEAQRRLIEEAPQRHAQTHFLEMARRARGLESEFIRLGGLSDRLQKAQKQWEEALKKCAQATALAEEAEAAYQLEQNRESEREAASQQVRASEELIRKVAELKKAVEAHQTLRFEHQQAHALYEEVQRKVDGLNLPDLETRFQESEHAQNRLDWIQSRHKRQLELLEERHALNLLEGQILRQQQEVETANDQAARAERHWAIAKREHGERRMRFLDSQIGRLASTLKPNEHCPVCGALEHPHPAPQTASSVTEEQLQQAQLAEEEAYEVFRQQGGRASQMMGELIPLTERATVLRDRLADSLTLSVGEIDLQRQALESQLHEVQLLSEQRDSRRQMYLETHEKERGLSEQLEIQLAVTKSLEGRVQEQATQLARLRQAIPADLHEQEVVGQQLEIAKRQHASLMRVFELTQQRWQAARENRIASDLNEQRERTLHETEESHWREQREKIQTLLQTNDFKDRQAYEHALLQPEAFQALEEQVIASERNVGEVDSTWHHAQAAVAHLERPELNLLSERFTQADQMYDSLLQQHSKLKADAERLSQDLAEVTRLESQFQQKSQVSNLLTELAANASGKGGARISYHRYVLAYYLDEVLRLASIRLKAMTRERYELRRSKDEKGGLEIELFDHHTGRARPTRSFSGGESFQAALALALSLGEVVQHRTGAHYLETVFIDEGFGSLDSEALDLAMECLAELQEHGRLVGVISHVQELQQYIPARLEIIPSQQGSKARFVIV